MVMNRVLIGAVVTLLSSTGQTVPAASDGGDSRPWNEAVQVHGALLAMFHQGQTGAMVTLDTVLPNVDLYGLGALADLSGEVTIVGGKAYLSYPDGAAQTRTEVAVRTGEGAALLVTAEVTAWSSLKVEHSIGFEDLDQEIARLAAAQGISLDRRFPFLLEGEFEDLRWHVIDGRRLSEGGASHSDHLAAAVRIRRESAPATLVGFYSERDEGVFTHMGSKTHVHCVLEEPAATGHVDHVRIPAGTIVKFPVVESE